MALSRAEIYEDDDGPSLSIAPMRRLPELPFPVNDEGFAAYVEWGQRLIDVGLLDDLNQELIVSLAISSHDLSKAIKEGRSPRYPMMARTAALKKLNNLYAGHSVSASSKSSNPYAHFGFAKRARQRRHGDD